MFALAVFLQVESNHCTSPDNASLNEMATKGICGKMSKRLDELKTGCSGRILSIEGDDSISVRLMEMGLTEGEAIKRVGESPFGDPIEFSVCGYRLVLRATEAARVQIEELLS